MRFVLLPIPPAQLPPKRTLHSLPLKLPVCSKKRKVEAGVHVAGYVCAENGREDEEREEWFLDQDSQDR